MSRHFDEFLSKVSRCLQVLLLSVHVCGDAHKAESLHELVDVDAPVLVEVHALSQVGDGLVADLHFQMGAQEFPGLMELLERDQTWNTDAEC